MDKRVVLENMKVVELKEICRESNILGISGKKKKDLIDLMIDCDLKKLHIPEVPPLEIIEEEEEEEEEEIILHIPIEVVNKSERWKSFYEKGKKILAK
tara:strand:+ start:275 stop:568 length:294 start_codon:yes stop_codon:yes gene_type:complete